MRQVNYNEKAWDEKRATKIFHYILTGDVAYASGIATKLDLNPQTVNNYISGLLKKGLITEKERIEGKIIYDADTEDLAERFYELLIDEVDRQKTAHQEEGNEEHVDSLEEVLENSKNQKSRIQAISLIEDYLNEVFKNREPGTLNISLNHLLMYEFSFSLVRYYYHTEPEDTEDWFESLITLLIESRISGWSINSVDSVMKTRKES